MIRIFLLVLGVLIGSSSVVRADALDTAIQAQIAKEQVPSLAVGRIRDQGAPDLRYYGANPKSLFRIASMTKMMTAIVVLQMSEEGIVDLDRPLVDQLPSFGALTDPATLRKITIRTVLSHTSGMTRDIGVDIWSNVKRMAAGDFPGLPEFHDGAHLQPIVYPPGTRLKYSNLGYVWLTELIAFKSKYPGTVSQRYAREVETRIFRKLGMQNSTVLLSRSHESDLVPPYGMVYPKLGGKRLALPKIFDIGVNAGAWGMVTTAEDLAKYAQWLLRANRGLGGQPLLKNQTCVEAFKPVLKDPVSPYSHGLGFQIFDYQGMHWIGHGGLFPGYRAALYVDPKNNKASFVVSDAIDLGTDWYIGALMQAPMIQRRTLLANSDGPVTTYPLDCLYNRSGLEKDQSGNYRITQGPAGSKLIPVGHTPGHFVIEDNQPYTGYNLESVTFVRGDDKTPAGLMVGRSYRCVLEKR